MNVLNRFLASIVFLAGSLAAWGQPGPLLKKEELVRQLNPATSRGLRRNFSVEETSPSTSQLQPTAPAAKPDGETLARPDADSMSIGDEPKATTPSVSLVIQFAINSHIIRPESARQLKELSAALQSSQLREFKFQIEGHSDDSGPLDLNMRLSDARAKSVGKWLIESGVRPDRLSTIGFGPTKPLPGLPPNARAHRRVVIGLAP